jgi:hypothetical protein
VVDSGGRGHRAPRLAARSQSRRPPDRRAWQPGWGCYADGTCSPSKATWAVLRGGPFVSHQEAIGRARFGRGTLRRLVKKCTSLRYPASQPRSPWGCFFVRGALWDAQVSCSFSDIALVHTTADRNLCHGASWGGFLSGSVKNLPRFSPSTARPIRRAQPASDRPFAAVRSELRPARRVVVLIWRSVGLPAFVLQPQGAGREPAGQGRSAALVNITGLF